MKTMITILMLIFGSLNTGEWEGGMQEACQVCLAVNAHSGSNRYFSIDFCSDVPKSQVSGRALIKV